MDAKRRRQRRPASRRVATRSCGPSMQRKTWHITLIRLHELWHPWIHGAGARRGLQRSFSPTESLTAVCGIVLMHPFGRAESLLPTSLGTFMQTSAPSPMTSMPVTTDASIAAATVHSVGGAVSETRRALAPCGIGKDVESMLEFCFELFPALTIGADFVRAPLGCLLSRPASVSS